MSLAALLVIGCGSDGGGDNTAAAGDGGSAGSGARGGATTGGSTASGGATGAAAGTGAASGAGAAGGASGGTGGSAGAGAAGGGGVGGGTNLDDIAVYEDPPWTEPAPPTTPEIEALLQDIIADSEAELGTGTSQLQADIDAHGRAAAGAAYAADLRLGAAAWIFASEPGPPTTQALVGLSAVVALGTGANRFQQATVLARAALAQLGDVSAEPIVTQRLAASAWNNLGRAELGLDNAPAAIHAYRQATSANPTDPAYRTGLAAALHMGNLLILARQEAIRAVANERLADPGLQADALRYTPARAWRSRIETDLQAGVAFASKADPTVQACCMQFPDVGSSILGMTVLRENPDGSRVVSPPPFEAHGALHLGSEPDCSVDGQGLVRIDCQGEDLLTTFSDPWFEVGTIGAITINRVNEPGLSCDNYLQRTFAPETRELTILDTVGIPGVSAWTSGLSFALGRELDAMEASLGVPLTEPPALERCMSYQDVAAPWATHASVVEAGCGGCSCGDGTCQTCWANYRSACEGLLQEAVQLVATEHVHARADDQRHVENLERYFAMQPTLAALIFGKQECDGDCVDAFEDDPRWSWYEYIGGRETAFLSRLGTLPARAYLSCMSQIPPPCPVHAGTPNTSDPSTVACVCLGAGPLGYCLAADGSIEVTVSAGISVGVKANIDAGASSLRFGVGAGASANWGPIGAGVSTMAWWDPATGAWSGGGISADLGLAVPGGGSVSSAFSCDAWQSDAPDRESEPDGFALEASPPGPDA